MNDEEWRSVVGWEGLYDVSNLGRVKRTAPARNGHAPGACLRPPLDSSGYQHVTLYRPGEQRVFRKVHVIVALAFLGPRPPGLQVNHMDGNKLNNRASNLEYVTLQENMRHRQPWSPPHRAFFSGKLGPEEALEIRRLSATGLSQRALAARFEVGRQSIREVLRDRILPSAQVQAYLEGTLTYRKRKVAAR
jgi:hypothetical protein